MNIFWSQEMSDEEVVERVRKQINAGRWLFLVISLLFFGMGLWWFSVAFDWIEPFSKRSGTQWYWFWSGVSAGFSLSLLSILLFGKAFLFLYLFLDRFPWRKDRLLIQYYDRLHRNSG